MKLRYVALLAVLILVNVDFIAPEAAALPFQSDDQWEIWNQVQATTSQSNTASPTQSTQIITLTAGHTYFYAFNVQTGTTVHNHLGSGVGLLDIADFAGDSNPTFGNKVVPGSGKVLFSQNVTAGSGTYNYQVAMFTMNVTVSARSEIAGTSSVGANQYSIASGSTTPCARTGIISYVGSFGYGASCSAGNEDSFLFEASIARQSEVSVTANQMAIDNAHLTGASQLNPDMDPYNVATCGAGSLLVGSQYGYSQSLTTSSSGGANAFFLHQLGIGVESNVGAGSTETLTFRLTQDQTPSATVNTLHDYSWGNITVTNPSGAGSKFGKFALDFLTKSVNSTNVNAAFSYSLVDWTLATLAPNISATGQPVYFQVIMQTGGTDTLNLVYGSSCGTYGGNMTFNGSTSTTNYAFRETLSVGTYAWIYGKSSYSFQLNTTSANVAGAIYAVITDVLTPGGFPKPGSFSSSFDGVSVPINSFLSGNTQTQLLRLAFPIDPTNSAQNGPWNTTGQWVFTYTPPADSRDFYSSQALTNQPTNTTNVALLQVPNTDGYSGGSVGLKVFQLFTTNDYFTQVSILPGECRNPNCIDSGAGVFNTTAFPNGVPITVTINHGGIFRTLVLTTANQIPSINIGATANFSGQDIVGATISLTYGGPQVQSQTWTGIVVSGSGAWTISNTGAFVSSGGGTATGSTTNVVCNPTNAAFNIGTQAIINVTWLTGGYYAIFMIQPSGIPGQLTNVFQLQATALPQPIAYPIGRNASLLPVNDTGSYIIGLMDANQKLQNTCPFTIGNATLANVDAGMLSYMNMSLSQQVVSANLEAQQKTQQTATHDFILDATTFAFRTDLYIPNIYLFLLLCMVVGVFMASVRGRSQ